MQMSYELVVTRGYDGGLDGRRSQTYVMGV